MVQDSLGYFGMVQYKWGWFEIGGVGMVQDGNVLG